MNPRGALSPIPAIPPIAIAIAALAVAVAACSASPGDPDAADAASPDDADSAFVFDESVIRTYELALDPADLQRLNDDPRREEYVPATLRLEGNTQDLVAVRYKGGFGTLHTCFDGDGDRICPKLSIKLKFNEYDPERRLFGLKRLNFHSMKSDPSQMHDVIGYALFREMNVIAPRATYARLVVNGEPLGLFALVEQIDGRFTRMNFPDGGEGNLYKEVWPEHATPAPYLAALKTNEDEDPSADRMLRFALELAAAGDQEFEATLARWTDIDMLMRFLAVDRLIDNWDGIVAWYCVGSCFNHNYYWYESTASDQVWLIPWDLDNTFEVPSPVRTAFGMPDWDDDSLGCTQVPVFLGIAGRPPACDPLIRRLAAITRDRYLSATRTLLDGPFELAAMHARIDALSQHIREAVAADPNGPGLAAWEDAVARLRADVPALRAYIESKLP